MSAKYGKAKLVLARETLRRLAAADLRRVVSGLDNDPSPPPRPPNCDNTDSCISFTQTIISLLQGDACTVQVPTSDTKKP
jgi:hypothetical protein